MKLDHGTIRAILFGAVQVWEDGGIHVRRCTDAQIRVWEAEEPVLGARSLSTTGIRLDFYTDSSFLKLRFGERVELDLYVDGILGACCSGAADYSLELGPGEHRLTVIFPSHNESDLRLLEVELQDGAAVRPHVFDRRILFLGDSITQGWGTSRDSLSFAWRVCFALNADCVNQGIGGTYALAESFSAELDYDPDLVVVAYGTNDWGKRSSAGELEREFRRYLDLVCERYKGKRLVGISPLWRDHGGQEKAMGSFDVCTEIVKKAILDHGMLLVDGFSMIPHQPLFFMDGLHPLDLGYEVYARNLLKRIGW